MKRGLVGMTNKELKTGGVINLYFFDCRREELDATVAKLRIISDEINGHLEVKYIEGKNEPKEATK